MGHAPAPTTMSRLHITKIQQGIGQSLCVQAFTKSVGHCLAMLASFLVSFSIANLTLLAACPKRTVKSHTHTLLSFAYNAYNSAASPSARPKEGLRLKCEHSTQLSCPSSQKPTKCRTWSWLGAQCHRGTMGFRLQLPFHTGRS